MRGRLIGVALSMLVAGAGLALAMTDKINSDGSKTSEVFQRRSDPSYRFAVSAFAPVATPTDFLVIQGNATKTLHIKRIALQGAATAAGNMPVQLIRRSTADTTTCVLTAITAAKKDTLDPTSVSTVSTVGTANCGSLGTSAGVLGAARLQMTALGTGVAIVPQVWEFATRLDKTLLVRGISDFVVLNLSGAALPAGGVIDVEVEIEEF